MYFGLEGTSRYQQCSQTDTSVLASTNLKTKIFIVCPQDYVVFPSKDTYITLVVFAAVQYTVIGFRKLGPEIKISSRREQRSPQTVTYNHILILDLPFLLKDA